jgi:prepilin-type N-terminal cleavage/methylation domain-containing protein
MTKKRRGMTLMELLVAVFIFVILTTMIVVNFQQLDRGRLLRENVTRVADLLREARVQTQVGIESDPPGGGDRQIPPGGYGVVVVYGPGTKDRFGLYGDWNGNHLYDRIDDVLLREKFFDRNVIVTACKQRDNLPAR